MYAPIAADWRKSRKKILHLKWDFPSLASEAKIATISHWSQSLHEASHIWITIRFLRDISKGVLNLPRRVPDHYIEHILFRCMDTAQESGLAKFLGDLSHIETNSEIKPPLRLQSIVGCTFIAQFFENANATLICFWTHCVTACRDPQPDTTIIIIAVIQKKRTSSQIRWLMNFEIDAF